MSDALKDTHWPSTSISDDTRKLIGDFFALADDKSVSAGPELASRIFSKNGIMKAAAGKFEGSEAIAKSRERAWDVISKRHHSVLKVYTFDLEGSDLLLIGRMGVWVAQRGPADIEFVGRIVTEHTSEGLRIKLYEVWADQTPVKQLLGS